MSNVGLRVELVLSIDPAFESTGVVYTARIWGPDAESKQKPYGYVLRDEYVGTAFMWLLDIVTITLGGSEPSDQPVVPPPGLVFRTSIDPVHPYEAGHIFEAKAWLCPIKSQLSPTEAEI